MEGSTKDRSDWIASVSCLNPMLNGNVATYGFGMNQHTNHFSKETVFGMIIPELAKYLMLIQNLVVRRQTLNTPHEVIE